MPLVKICGLTRPEDAAAASAAGARYGGVILAPGYARSVDAARAQVIFGDLPVVRVGVFVDALVGDIRSAVDAAGAQVVQLHGSEPPGTARALRDGGLEVWKALRPRDADDFISGVQRYAGSVDAILLDGWSSGAPGGEGARFPWGRIAPHRRKLPSDIRLVVAGGLRTGILAEVIEALDPDVVDVSSGVESARGVKDHVLVRQFVAEAGATQKGVL